MAEELKCSICQDVFNDPVSTSCGHNFCKNCLKQFWDNSQVYRCPNCNKTFQQRPDLKINTTLRDVVDQHEKKLQENRQRASETHNEDVIKYLEQEITELKKRNNVVQKMMEKQRAAEKHDKDVIKYLEQEITELEKRNIELEMIAENQRAVETQDKCLIGDMKKEITELEKRNNDLKMNIDMQEALKKKYEDVLKHLNQEISELKKRNIELQKMMEKQRAKEKHDEDVIKYLHKEITELKRRIYELELIEENQRAVETQDKDLIRNLKCEITKLKRQIHKLEMIAENQRAAETQNKCLIRNLKFEITELMTMKQKQIQTVKQCENHIKKLNQENTDLKRTNIKQQQQISNTENDLRLLQEQHQVLRHQKEISFGFSCVCLFLLVCVGVVHLLAHFADHTPQSQVVKEWRQQYAVDVTLDSYTAHPNLILSDDKKQVRHTNTQVYYLTDFWRFTSHLNVLGTRGFSSGAFYFEVQVKRKIGWTLGVVRESVNRKKDVPMTPVNGYWVVSMRNQNEYVAHDDPDVFLSLRVNPQKVGVFVDYEGRYVSFYDAESGSHIYSFTDQSFTGKLYPVLNPWNNNGKNSDPLIITPIK